MKVLLRLCLSVALLAALSGYGLGAQQPAPPGSPVAKHGWLGVAGSKIVDSTGAAVQLRGMSTMGLQWYGGIVNDAAFKALALDWKVDVVRLAMYVGEGGYATNPAVKDTVMKGIDLAARYGLYVIVDWHVLNPGNPNDPIYAGADAFFAEVAKKYASLPNVIYEIMNEPNGQLSWQKDLKPYAERLVSEIRAIAPDNLIIIGSGRWSQDVDAAADDPVAGRNLAYAVHFYAGTHGSALRDKIQYALDEGLAIFCTEWGTSLSSGNGGPFLDQAREWLAFLDERKIGWVNWSLCAKAETSAAFKGGTSLTPRKQGPDGYAIWGDDELREGGAFVKAALLNH